MVQLFDSWMIREPFPGKPDPRTKNHLGHGKFALGILRDDANGFIHIIINDEASLGRDGEKPKHVATRETRNKCLFRINGFGH